MRSRAATSTPRCSTPFGSAACSSPRSMRRSRAATVRKYREEPGSGARPIAFGHPPSRAGAAGDGEPKGRGGQGRPRPRQVRRKSHRRTRRRTTRMSVSVPRSTWRPTSRAAGSRRSNSCGWCWHVSKRSSTAGAIRLRTTAGRAAHDQGDGAQNQNRLGAVPQRHRRALPRRQEDHAGDGQPQHPPPRRPLRGFSASPGQALWDRFEFVYTPKHGSWLNVAEVELNVMIRQCLNRRIASLEVLSDEVAAWQASRDRIQAKVNWQFTTHDARVKLKRLYPTLDE